MTSRNLNMVLGLVMQGSKFMGLVNGGMANNAQKLKGIFNF